VAHPYNPSYSGDRGDQEDFSSKPAQAKTSRNPISRKKITTNHHKKELVAGEHHTE
jgi:hypothetical protein